MSFPVLFSSVPMRMGNAKRIVHNRSIPLVSGVAKQGSLAEARAMMRRWQEGEWRRWGGFAAEIDPRDRGVMHGLSIFETMLGWHGKVALWPRHAARFRGSAAALGWRLPEDLDDWVAEAISSITAPASRVRLTITGGRGPIDSLALGEMASLRIDAVPLGNDPRDSAAGLRAMIAPWPRAAGPGIAHKHGSYFENISALDRARENGMDEAIWLSPDRIVTEGCRHNLFLRVNQQWRTAAVDDGCLPGVARAWLLDRFRSAGVCCEIRGVGEHELGLVDAAILTNAVAGPRALLEIGAHALTDCDELKEIRNWWSHDVMPPDAAEIG